MKSAFLLGNGEVIIKDVPKPTPAAGEVLVKTTASALCGSEMHAYRHQGVADGNRGHEAAGIVIETGEGVPASMTGRRVGVSAIAGCGDCDYCRKGQYTWCDRWRFFNKMHSEYFVAPALACHPLPDDVPWDVGVLITGDGLGVPYHTSTKIRDPGNRSIALFGLGPVGLGNVLLQSHLGRQVIGVDRAPDRLEFAKRLGAKSVLLAEEGVDIPARIRELTGGRGADVCIEAAGSPVTAKQCFAAVRKGGVVIFNGEQPKIELSPSEDFIRRDITAMGAWFYHFSEFTPMLELFRQKLPVASLITHRFSIDQIQTAYRAMADAKSGKVLLEYGSTK